MGLLILAYNRAVYATAQTANASGITKVLKMDSVPLNYQHGHILEVRGAILQQLGKFLEAVLPKPACYLAKFDHDSLSEYCEIHGDPLMRHIRGIYPEIDTEDFPALQFLPYYEFIHKQDIKMVAGNRNWKTARKVVQCYYDKKIAREGNAPFDSYGIITPKNHELGIRLSYIMLLGRKEEMVEYWEYLKSTIPVYEE